MSEESTSTVSTVDEAVAAFKAKVIDGAVRASRTNGWCSSFEEAMAVIFPEGSGEPDGDWYDSDGYTCRGYDRAGFHQRSGRNQDGYDRAGFNEVGFDAEGFNQAGYDRSGYNRERVNSAGLRFDDPANPYRFDHNGYDVNGWHHSQDVNLSGYSRQRRTGECQYDRDGWNAAGLNRYGDRRPS